MEKLLANPYLQAWVERRTGVISLARTAVGFDGFQDVVTALDEFLTEVRRLHLGGSALLFDCRAAPIPPAGVDRAVFRMEQQLARRFRPMVMVVPSAEAFDRAARRAQAGVHYFSNPAGARRALLSLMEDSRAVSTSRGLGPSGPELEPAVPVGSH